MESFPLAENGPAYPPGRAVARKAHEYFARHHEQLQKTTREKIASVPSAEAIEDVINAAFWASLRREEGQSPRVSIAIVTPEEAVHPLVFEEALPLTPGSLIRISPAVRRSVLHIAVWKVRDELCAWGTARSIPISCCVIEIVAPGLLVIKHRSILESGKFVNVAVLEGDQIKLVDQRASTTADCPPLVSSLLGCESTPGLDSIDILNELAVSMRAHERGRSATRGPR